MLKNIYEITPSVARSLRSTLGDVLDRAVRRTPNKDALCFADRTWSYEALATAANRIANDLLAQGLRPGDRVAAYGKNSDAYLLLWLACNRAGLIHVPVNYALTGGELHYIFEQSGSRAVFHDTMIAQHVIPLKDRLSCEFYGTFYGSGGGGSSSGGTFYGSGGGGSGGGTFYGSGGQSPGGATGGGDRSDHGHSDRNGGELNILAMAKGSGNPAPPDIEITEDAVAQILYTSGTTSSPKGAMMTHRALFAEYTSAIIGFEIHPDDRALASLPLYHSAQMHAFLMPLLLRGSTTLLIPAPEPEACFKLIERERITSFFAPPTVWISLLRHPGFDKCDLSSLKKGYYGASIMPLPVLEELRTRLPNMDLYNAYGQSEIAPLATVLSPADHLVAPASAGRPVLNVQTRVVNERMEDTKPGEAGEIVHRSSQLMVGYWNMSEQTEEAFTGDWFHSGDVGYFDEHGFLYVVDRIKDVINTGGVLVSSREVEECLYGHPAVAEVAVIALPDEKWVEAVSAVISLKAGAKASEQELIEFAKGRMAPFKVPKSIHFKSELPRNNAGKLLKRELRKEYAV